MKLGHIVRTALRQKQMVARYSMDVFLKIICMLALVATEAARRKQTDGEKNLPCNIGCCGCRGSRCYSSQLETILG